MVKILQQNWIYICETADTVCLLNPLCNDQMYHKLSQLIK